MKVRLRAERALRYQKQPISITRCGHSGRNRSEWPCQHIFLFILQWPGNAGRTPVGQNWRGSTSRTVNNLKTMTFLRLFRHEIGSLKGLCGLPCSKIFDWRGHKIKVSCLYDFNATELGCIAIKD
jgi:hypothetical protein